MRFSVRMEKGSAKENDAKGKVEGRVVERVETGYEFGISENDILESLQSKLNIFLQAAQEYLKMSGKKTI